MGFGAKLICYDVFENEELKKQADAVFAKAIDRLPPIFEKP